MDQSEIIWDRYLLKDELFDRRSLIEYERRQGIILPSGYAELVQAHMGDTPHEGYVEVEGFRRDPGYLFGFTPTCLDQPPEARYTVPHWHLILSQEFEQPPELIPFMGGFGYTIAFDYRQMKENPPIVLVVMREDDLRYRVANDLDDFMGNVLRTG